MAFDVHKNFSWSHVATAPSPADTGTSLVVTAAEGTLFPAVPFNAVVWPKDQVPTSSNAEVVRVTNIVTDTLTITRTQEGSSARTIVAGDQIAASVTAKTLTDIETASYPPTVHDILTAHSYTGGAALDVFGLSAANTLAKLTPSSNPGAAAAILATNASGLLTLVGLTTTAVASLTTPAESWVGPSSTTGIYFKGGNIGIGTISPERALHVKGDAFLIERPINGPAVIYRNTLDSNFPTQEWITGAVVDIGAGTDNLIFSYRPTNVFPTTVVLTATKTGNVGIGTTGPDTLLHTRLLNATTNAINNVLTIGHDSSGTPAAGFGSGLIFNLHSSTTTGQVAALMTAQWIVATHASRTARLALSAYDYNGAREGIRIDADGSQALLGFFGVAAVAKQAKAGHNNWAAISDVVSALVNLGLLDSI